MALRDVEDVLIRFLADSAHKTTVPLACILASACSSKSGRCLSVRRLAAAAWRRIASPCALPSANTAARRLCTHRRAFAHGRRCSASLMPIWAAGMPIVRLNLHEPALSHCLSQQVGNMAHRRLSILLSKPPLMCIRQPASPVRIDSAEHASICFIFCCNIAPLTSAILTLNKPPKPQHSLQPSISITLAFSMPLTTCVPGLSDRANAIHDTRRETQPVLVVSAGR